VPGSVQITAFYKFLPIAKAELPALRQKLLSFGVERDMCGLVLLAEEGINGTVCGEAHAIRKWKDFLIDRFGGIDFKDSAAARPVFKHWAVKIKPEIVAIKKSDIQPRGTHKHLSPEEWHAMLNEDVVLVDARNSYEYGIGAFENAIDPGLESFQQFPEYAKHANLPKQKKILLYCTGGIRCEKAILEMEKNGYENVYQLQGGILAYLRQFPEGKFKGECFVFDRRVAVDEHLRPSAKYSLCPHCGHPGDVQVQCLRCSKPGLICTACAAHRECNTCSKDCKHRLQTCCAVAA
jgi:UPF0176 protein